MKQQQQQRPSTRTQPCKQLLAGWTAAANGGNDHHRRGTGTTRGEGTMTRGDNDKGEGTMTRRNHPHGTPTPRREQLLAGWKGGATGGDSDEGTHHQTTPTRGGGRDQRGEGDDNGEGTATTTEQIGRAHV